MVTTLRDVTVIPATIDNRIYGNEHRILKVASYSRVSTDFEEQLTSFHAQKLYYTDLIMRTKGWKLAGTYADEGISGANAKNRPEFQKMIKHCKKGKIDLIITKSISRFARNTIDSIEYVRKLKRMGVGVLFEKENINTLEQNSEVILTILAALAQEELVSLSSNVKMGIRMAMKEGRYQFRYHNVYAYKKGADGNPEIIPEDAEVVRRIYKEYLKGRSSQRIADMLNDENIKSPTKGKKWSDVSVRRILQHERYVGDLILQKTFIQDPLSKKVIKNVGQLPKYLIKNNHIAIVDRADYDRVQAEFAKRRSKKKATSQGKSELGKHSSLYALTGILLCGDCGTPYKRTIWTRKRANEIIKTPVWRCYKRIDYGTKYCSDSVTVDELSLQKAIMESITITKAEREKLVPILMAEIESVLWEKSDGELNIDEVEKQIDALKAKAMEIVAESAINMTVAENQDVLRSISDQMRTLSDIVSDYKTSKSSISVNNKIKRIQDTLEKDFNDYTTYNDDLIRQIISGIKVMDEHSIKIYYKCGLVVDQAMELQIKPFRKTS